MQCRNAENYKIIHDLPIYGELRNDSISQLSQIGHHQIA